MAKQRIGDVLIQEGLLQPEQLTEALRIQQIKGGRLGEILIGQGIISEDDFQQFLSRHFGLDYYSPAQLMTHKIDDGLLTSVPYDTALQYLVLPLSKENNILDVVSLAPLSKADTQMFRRLTRTLELRYSLGTRPGLNQAIRFHYGRHLKKQASTSPNAAFGGEGGSQEIVKLRREGNCTQCGYPCGFSDRNCTQCGAILRDAADPFVGQVVGNKWRLGQLIGEGGMGIVYEGIHLDTQQKCAIKLLRTQIKRDDAVIQRFYREVQILRKLKHPGIIEVYEFDFKEGMGFYLVMELLQGCTFAEYIEHLGLELPYSEIYLIVSQICSAMSYAHDEGVVHRDLKPENVFLLGGPHHIGKVKMLDFGIAKLQEHEQNRLTQTGMTLGTPHYLSPEQAVAQPVDHRSDIYSLSVLLFELLTGQMLFDAESPFQYLMRHVYSEPRTLSQARRDKKYPQQLEDLVAEGLAKTPEERPDSMYSFKRRLQASISEILRYDPDEHVKTIAPHMYSGEHSFKPTQGRGLDSTGDLICAPDSMLSTQPDIEDPYANTHYDKPTKESLPDYIIAGDEWDDEDEEDNRGVAPAAKAPPKTPAPILPDPQAVRASNSKLLIRKPTKGHSDNLAAPKSRVPIRGAVWEAAHKKDRKKRLFLWSFGLVLLLSIGSAAGTYPSWKHHIFPTDNELRQAKQAWSLFKKQPKGYWEWRGKATKKTRKRRRRRRRRKSRRRRRKRKR